MFNVLRRLGLIVLVVCAAARPAGAEDAVKISVLGDSLSAGFGLMAHEAFPAQLEARLRDHGVEVSVLNAGVSGDTSAGGVARVDWVLGDNPQFVILELGANDGLRGLDTAQMKTNLAAIIEKLQARGVRVLLAGMVAPAQSRARLWPSLQCRLSRPGGAVRGAALSVFPRRCRRRAGAQPRRRHPPHRRRRGGHRRSDPAICDGLAGGALTATQSGPCSASISASL